jgi:hypothetical protein
MNSNPNNRDQPYSGEIEKRQAAQDPAADTWRRSSTRRKDGERIPTDDSELPTHVVGEHHTD